MSKLKGVCLAFTRQGCIGHNEHPDRVPCCQVCSKFKTCSELKSYNNIHACGQFVKGGGENVRVQMP